MLRQNPTISEQLQTTGLIPAGAQLEAGDIKALLQDLRCDILNIHANISTQAQEPESLIDDSLTHVMQQALTELDI